MVSAIWSMPPYEASKMPITFFLKFFQNHGLFKLKNRPQWYTVSNRNRTYVNKVIEVSGVIKDISLLNDRYTVFLKSETFSKNFVMCDMSPSGKIQGDQLTIGDSITLKGVCKGYLLDVIMLNCIPIDEKPKK